MAILPNFELNESERQKLDQFKNITSFPDEELILVVKLLRNHSWQLEPALSRYFDGGWKENLDPPLLSSRPSANMMASGVLPDMGATTGAAAFIPSLPVITPMPMNYKDRFVGIGPSGRPRNPIMLLLMILPNVFFDLVSFLWGLVSFGWDRQDKDSETRKSFAIQKVAKFPSYPPIDEEEMLSIKGGEDSCAHESASQEKVMIKRNTFSEIEAFLQDDEARHLLSFVSNASFNTLLRECESSFRFMLVIFLGDLDTDVNSQRFLKNILSDESTLAVFSEYADDLCIYIGSCKDKEQWYVGKYLNAKFTPECFLIANVLNSNGSPNGSYRMSLLGKIRLTTLKRFQKSLKSHIDTYAPGLLVSRTEKQQLEFSRKLKEMQDKAYQESLKLDRRKDELKKQAQQQLELIKRKEMESEYIKKLQVTTYNLYWLKTALETIAINENDENDDSEGCPENSKKFAVLQIRTSDGKRMIKRYPGNTTLRHLYLSVGSHLFLQETSNHYEAIHAKLIERINKISKDESFLCFKGDFQIPSNHAEIKSLVYEELNKWKMVLKPSNSEVNFINFELVSPFPRYELPLDNMLEIEKVNQIWPNGNLLVEYIEDDQLE